MAGRMKLGVLISGRGSNLQALIDACADPAFPAEIALVLSNRADAQGLQRASAGGIPTRVIDHRGFSRRADFDAALHGALVDSGVELVCLAGFMRLLDPEFVEAWQDRLINIHPSLLPAFRGLHTHERALEAGVKFTGCTVHFVRPDVDNGPIILQAAVPVLTSDTPDSLAERVLAAEHVCYPAAVRWIAEGRVRIAGNNVLLAGGAGPDQSVFNPLADKVLVRIEAVCRPPRVGYITARHIANLRETSMEAAPSDVRRHQQFWNGFCRFLTIGSASVAVILVLMALFLL